MGIVIGPVLRRADAYRFAPGRGQGGDQRLSLSANRRRTLCAECRDQGICAGSRSVRDRLPDPRRVHREIHRVRDARRRLTGLVRQSRHLAGRCRVMGAVKISPFYRTARARWHAERQSKCLGSRRSGLAAVVSTRAAPSSASVEPIYTLSNAPIVSEG